jgi:hypothetical protein
MIRKKKKTKENKRCHVGFDATMILGLIVGASTGFDWNPWVWLQVDPQNKKLSQQKPNKSEVQLVHG